MIANWKSAGRMGLISALLLLMAACGGNEKASPTASETSQPEGTHKIQHVVMIMQENRSFDHYFGTFPGAEGIPMKDGVPTVCVADPRINQCVKPYHDPNDLNYGGPHEASAAVADIDGGKMDGFIGEQIIGGTGGACAIFPNNPNCSGTPATPDVMGYHDAREIPNYWTYAEQFVLQDHMFEPNASWSLPAHLFMVSEWSAQCSRADDPSSCVNAMNVPDWPAPENESTLYVTRTGAIWCDRAMLFAHGSTVSGAGGRYPSHHGRLVFGRHRRLVLLQSRPATPPSLYCAAASAWSIAALNVNMPL